MVEKWLNDPKLIPIQSHSEKYTHQASSNAIISPRNGWTKNVFKPLNHSHPKTQNPFNNNVPWRSSVTFLFRPSSVSSVRQCFARCGWSDSQPQFLEEMSPFLGQKSRNNQGYFLKKRRKRNTEKKQKNTPTRPTGQTSIHQVFGQIHPVISRILRFPKIKASTNCKAVRNQRMFFSLFFLKLPVELTIESPNHQSGGSWRPSWW